MKKKEGFSLVEVLATMVILGFLMYAIVRREIWSLITLGRGKGQIERVFLIKKYLYKVLLDLSTKEEKFKRKGLVKKIEDPEVEISVQKEEISRKSSLNEFGNFARIVNVSGEWREGGKVHAGPLRSIRLISFILDLPEEEK